MKFSKPLRVHKGIITNKHRGFLAFVDFSDYFLRAFKLMAAGHIGMHCIMVARQPAVMQLLHRHHYPEGLRKATSQLAREHFQARNTAKSYSEYTSLLFNQ